MFAKNTLRFYTFCAIFFIRQLCGSDPLQEYMSVGQSDGYWQPENGPYFYPYYQQTYDSKNSYEQVAYTDFFINNFLQRVQAEYLARNSALQGEENSDFFLYQLQQNLYGQLCQFDPSQYEAASQQIMHAIILAYEESFFFHSCPDQESFISSQTSSSNNISEPCLRDWREHLKKQAFSKLQKDVTGVRAQVDHLATEVSDMRTTVTQELQNMQASIALIAAAVQAQAERSEIRHKELLEQQQSDDGAQPKKSCVDACTNTLAILQRNTLLQNTKQSKPQPSCQDAWQRAQHLQETLKKDNMLAQQPCQDIQAAPTSTDLPLTYKQSLCKTQKNTKASVSLRASDPTNMVVLTRKNPSTTAGSQFKNHMRSWASDSDEETSEIVDTLHKKNPTEARSKKINFAKMFQAAKTASTSVAKPEEEGKELAYESFCHMQKAFSNSGINEDLGRTLLQRKLQCPFESNDKLLERLQEHLSLQEAINITTGVTDYPAVEKILTVLEEKSGQYARRFNQLHHQPK